MKIPQYVYRSIISAIVFFFSICTLSIGFAVFTSLSNVATGDNLSKDIWNTMVASVNDLGARMWWGWVKAWVYFNWASCSTTCSIYSSYNVSSVVRNSAGVYTVNFTTSMNDANYIVAPEAYMDPTDNTVRILWPIAKNTTSVKIRQVYADGSGYMGWYDYPRLWISVFWN